MSLGNRIAKTWRDFASLRRPDYASKCPRIILVICVQMSAPSILRERALQFMKAAFCGAEELLGAGQFGVGRWFRFGMLSKSSSPNPILLRDDRVQMSALHCSHSSAFALSSRHFSLDAAQRVLAKRFESFRIFLEGGSLVRRHLDNEALLVP